MTDDEFRRALDVAETLPLDVLERVENLIGTIGIKEPLLPELIRRARAYEAAVAAPDAVEAALKANFGAAGVEWPPEGTSEAHDLALEMQRAMMSAALAAAGIKTAEAVAEETKRLRARVRVLEEALRPFAAVAENDIGDDETDLDLFRPLTRNNRAPRLRVEDFRRAAAALIGMPMDDQDWRRVEEAMDG